MSDGLDLISRHINRVLAQQTHPLFLDVDTELRLRQWRGKAQRYGLPSLETGMSLADPLAMLATADPAQAEGREWRFVELPTGGICHAHALPLPDGWAIALLDASVEHAEQQARQQTAHELLLLRNERERMIAELDAANRLKSEFIGRMSHEFRTPLASVMGYSDTLAELRRDDPEIQYHLDAVGRGARYLLNLVENLLDQARIENDQLTLNPSGCDLHEMSDEVEQLLRPVAEQKALSLAWWFDSATPARVWVDATRLKQVLINLVGNAIKFTKTGSVNVEFDWQDGQLHVGVQDTGPGIAEDEVDQIFEPFRQGGGSIHGKGAGLGLAISRTLVEAMGGRISLSSRVGEGSRFDFHIRAEAVRGGPGGDTSTVEGKIIVLADDDPDLLELVQLYLRAAGCTVHTARNANEARTAVARFRPDAVLLDLNLGQDDGHALAANLRRSGYRRPIVSLSAAGSDNTRAAGMNPFDAQWSKPITRGRLLDDLADLLNKAQTDHAGIV